MATIVKAKFELHEAAQRSVLAAYRDERLYQDAAASLAEKHAGGSPTPREQLRMR